MHFYLNWLDILLLIILLITFILGLVKGFIRQVIGIMAVIGGVILASRYYPWLSWKFHRQIESEFWRNCLSFLLIFFAVILAGWFIGFVMHKLMKGPLSMANHLLGGGIGLVKGLLIGTVIVFALLTFNFQRQALIGSRLAPFMLKVSKAMTLLIPDSLKKNFDETWRKFEGKGDRHEQKI